MSLVPDVGAELKRYKDSLSQLRDNFTAKAEALSQVIEAIDLQLAKLGQPEEPKGPEQGVKRPEAPSSVTESKKPVDPKRRAAALKAWITIRKKYPQGQLAKKAWDTMRANGTKPPARIRGKSAIGSRGPERNPLLLWRAKEKVKEAGVDPQAIDWRLTYSEIMHQLDELTGKIIPKFAILQAGGML